MAEADLDAAEVEADKTPTTSTNDTLDGVATESAPEASQVRP